ncbi:DegT/DnrJ/EryC1/StrS family aminotransferase [Dechloromonas sp. XY25]|uniref:DegT/DnrJ/EryC1/StrS family aminotransferase n=1 Tax=Dechloromonas hankyongensis TaxID=2908002 RepID=A0ABS9K3L0_9RHOO|nr:DegT/DnrJ/EryC1/StrS family aminotransferase [Dechloromonas hankyongensis]MCG2577762.1 DegT/DnrJ/EryC1/StrS family aminotransferase [Dechloromonas hankyongensis]
MTWLSESGYRVFNPQRFQFPSPQVPILPTRLDIGSGDFGQGEYTPVTDSKNYQFFSWGRYALLEAFRLSNVGPGGYVLIPAYHCRTMLDPALSLQSEIRLYPLNAELSPDIPAIEALILESKLPIRALLATHYFGFPQSLDRLKALCNKHEIVLIEDCSHAFIRSRVDMKTGALGTFVVASPYKFCPTMDGGVLIGNGVELTRELIGRGLFDEVSSAVRLLTRARVRKHALLGTKSPLAEIIEKDGDHSWEDGRGISSAYDPASTSLRGYRLSHWIVRHSSADRIARQRRENFSKWLAGVDALPGCRPLYSDLPDGVVPYMFPLYLDRPLPDFYGLKNQGLPIWRWDSMGISGCAIATDYRLHLLHLPCHQDIGGQEITWMLETLEQVLKRLR